MVAGKLFDLFSLLVDNVGGIVNVVVDKLFVRLVDKRGKEEHRS